MSALRGVREDPGETVVVVEVINKQINQLIKKKTNE